MCSCKCSVGTSGASIVRARNMWMKPHHAIKNSTAAQVELSSSEFRVPRWCLGFGVWGFGIWSFGTRALDSAVSHAIIRAFRWGRTGFDHEDAPEAACRGWFVGLVKNRTEKIKANEELALAA